MFDLEFWKNFLSNALATFVGVIIGIPVALWINRIQQKAIDVTEQKKLKVEAKERKRKILQLISNELTSNQKLLLNIQNKSDGIFLPPKGHRVSDFYQLRIELWNSFSDGGELEWIDDLDLLQAMASAYENIKIVLSTGKDYYSFRRTNALRPSDAEFETFELSEKFEDSIKVATSQVDNALKVISSSLE